MIFTYNKEHVGDVLMVIVKDSKGAKLNCERRSKVTRIFLEKIRRQWLGIFLRYQICLILMAMDRYF